MEKREEKMVKCKKKGGKMWERKGQKMRKKGKNW